MTLADTIIAYATIGMIFGSPILLGLAKMYGDRKR